MLLGVKINSAVWSDPQADPEASLTLGAICLDLQFYPAENLLEVQPPHLPLTITVVC